MNLAAIVASAMRAVPIGVRGVVTISRVVPGAAYEAVSDTRQGDTPQAMSALPCVVGTPEPDALLPAGVDRHRVRDVTLAAAVCTTFQPDVGHTVTLNGKPFRLIEVTPEAPDGVTPVAYTLRGVL